MPDHDELDTYIRDTAFGEWYPGPEEFNWVKYQDELTYELQVNDDEGSLASGRWTFEPIGEETGSDAPAYFMASTSGVSVHLDMREPVSSTRMKIPRKTDTILSSWESVNEGLEKIQKGRETLKNLFGKAAYQVIVDAGKIFRESDLPGAMVEQLHADDIRTEIYPDGENFRTTVEIPLLAPFVAVVERYTGDLYASLVVEEHSPTCGWMTLGGARDGIWNSGVQIDEHDSPAEVLRDEVNETVVTKFSGLVEAL